MKHAYSFFSLLIIIILSGMQAQALPAFSRRENVSCSMCHVNGSFPRLNEFGYLYRRVGFRNPWEIGNKDKDAAS